MKSSHDTFLKKIKNIPWQWNIREIDQTMISKSTLYATTELNISHARDN